MGFSLIVSSATYTLFGRSRSYSLVMFDLSWISFGVVLRAINRILYSGVCVGAAGVRRGNRSMIVIMNE